MALGVFPTRVGVNREHQRPAYPQLGIPHTRGGEPGTTARCISARAVFPTRVGVNRPYLPPKQKWGRIPHTRGGEPLVDCLSQGTVRIPHTRGGEPQVTEGHRLRHEYSPHAWG